MRLIDADKLFDYIQKEKAWKQDTYKQPRYGRGKYDAYYEMLDIIKEQPTINTEPVVHAHWKMKIVKTGYWYECSNCGSHWSINGKTHECEQTPYCSHCGAKMDEEAEQE